VTNPSAALSKMHHTSNEALISPKQRCARALLKVIHFMLSRTFAKRSAFSVRTSYIVTRIRSIAVRMFLLQTQFKLYLPMRQYILIVFCKNA